MTKLILLIFSFLISINLCAEGNLIIENQKWLEDNDINSLDCNSKINVEQKQYILTITDIVSLQLEEPYSSVENSFIKSCIEDSIKCINGSFDAKKYHGKKGQHILLGMFLGPYAMIGTALSNPTPERGEKTMSMSKNNELFNDPEYRKCYKKKAKRQLIGMEAIGTGISIISLGILLRDLFE
jgi:hypothetical protein